MHGLHIWFKKYEFYILPLLIIGAVLLLVRLFSVAPDTGTREREKVLPLKEGDTIGILAPAAHGGMTDYNRSIELLESLGYKVKLAPSVTDDYGYLAGSDEERAKDLNDFFKDDSVKAIVCLRGGYGSARLLDKLDYDMIAHHPKMLIGFSDITALHAAIGEKAASSPSMGP